MPFVLESPTCVRIPKEFVEKLRPALAYVDSKTEFLWRKRSALLRTYETHKDKKHYFAPWQITGRGYEVYKYEVEELERDRHRSLLFEDRKGFWTYSGLAPKLAAMCGAGIVGGFKVPAKTEFPWAKKPFGLRPYQQEAVDALLDNRVGTSKLPTAIELATGGGKTRIIAELIHRVGGSGVVMVPTLSIAEQMVEVFSEWFGASNVGRYFGSKKQAEKNIVVAVSRSLSLTKEDSPAWKNLAKKKLVAFDESHLTPAETLTKVVFGVLKDIPYRFSVSGTQVRGDGAELLLEGIIGPKVFEADVRDLVDSGYLAKPLFYQIKIKSDDTPPLDSLECNRVCYHANSNIYDHVEIMVAKELSVNGRVLILVDEITQFIYLYPKIKKYRVGFAHGPLTGEREKSSIPKEFHKSNANQLVQDFDAGNLDVIVGTSCVNTGTDFKTPTMIIDLVGLASEVRVKQSVGRGTRMGNGKTSFKYVDYDVVNVPKISGHAAKRRDIFNDIYGPVKIIKS